MKFIKSKEMLEMVLLNIRSMTQVKLNHNDYSAYKFKIEGKTTSSNSEYSVGNHRQYVIHIREKGMDYAFSITIGKEHGFKIFGMEFFANYFAFIKIAQNQQWGGILDTIFLSTKENRDVAKLIKECYTKIEENNKQIDVEKQAERAESYVKELSKSVDKSLLRDDKLTDLLK